MIFAIEANENQMRQVMAEPQFRKVIMENPNAIIVLTQSNQLRVLHDAAGKGGIYNRPTRGPNILKENL